MNVLDKIRQTFGAKTLEQIKHPGRSGLFFRPSKPQATQMATEVGTGLGANVVLSPIRWIQRNAVEATASLKRTSDGELVSETHPLLSLLEKPNDFYSGAQLLAATIFSLETAGDAYWLKQSGFAGRPKALWYTPHWLITPKWPDSGDEFISHYAYQPGNGPTQRIDIEDVVHFRNGINPENTRMGLSPLSGLLAEIWSDMEAGSFVGAIMRNGGVPGLLFSPRGDTNEMSPEDVEELKNKLNSEFSGERRGNTLVSSVDARLEQFGYDPKQLDLSTVRNTAEERVCAALGIPAAVVGFGTGMQQTKVGATMRELRKEAWIGGILPLLTMIAAEIQRSLMPDFQSSDTLKFQFDASNVPALSEDRDLVEARIMKRVEGGVITVNEGRVDLGLEEEPGQDVYLRPFSVIEVPQGTAGRQIGSEEEADLGAPDKGEKAHGPDDHSALERRVAENNRRLAKPPKALVALADQIDRIRDSSAVAFEKRLSDFFEELGRKAEASARRVLGKEGAALITKQGEEAVAAQILEGMAMADELPIFEQLFQQTYLKVANDTAAAMEGTIGLVSGVPDPVARSIIAAAGKQVGLVDLNAQTQKAIFDGLLQGSARGLGPIDVAAGVRQHVAIGPRFAKAAENFRDLINSIPPNKRALTYALRDRRFDSTIRAAIQNGTQLSSAQVEKMFTRYIERAIKYRSEVIARTEMAFATNVSSLELGKSIGANEAVVFDARLGSTDATCEALNGRVVSLSDARGLMFDEHPNGTRSFTPVPPTLEL